MLKKRLRFLIELFTTAADRFSEVEGFRLGASFAYYATFSIFPLMLLAVTVLGFLVGDDAPARERVLDALAAPATPARDVLASTLTAMQESRSSRGTSAAIAAFTLLFSASGAMVEFYTALNRIWCVPDRKAEGVVGTIRVFVYERLSAFALVAALGLTLLASLVGSAILKVVTDTAQQQVDTPLWPGLVRTSELTLSMCLLAAVFTSAFHFIPRKRPPFRDVVGGAVLTTVLLTILKEVFATYLANLTSYSAYGVVGGVLALATWIFLTSQVIFFGAQLTRVHAEKIGSVDVCKRTTASTESADAAA